MHKPIKILFHIPLTEYFLAWHYRLVLVRKHWHYDTIKNAERQYVENKMYYYEKV